MQHSPKYVIHADIRTSGVVERSDVVGAIFGQTEGLLGDDMDLRDLQEASKVGRIDVDVDSEGGRSFGTITIASGLDRAETAVLAAALETIDRVGPCRSNCEVVRIEDARAAKRRKIVDRATELLAEFESERLTSDRLVEEVRERLRESELTEYHGLPAGPRVANSDAIIVVEGRADVRQLLSYGIKNAIAVEGTDVPDAVARLSTERTATAFLDGDRGGDLILRELAQVGDIDYVAFAPSGKSVEDLDRAAIMGALRKKIPYEEVGETNTPREVFAPADGGTVGETGQTESTEESATESELDRSQNAVDGETTTPERVDTESKVSAPAEGTESTSEGASADSSPERETAATEGPVTPAVETVEGGETVGVGAVEAKETANADTTEAESASAVPEESETVAEETGPTTLGDHIREVVESGSETIRLLDEEFDCLAERPASDAFDAIESAETVPHTLVLDETVSQRILDIAAQRGVGQIIATETGEFVKQPVSVRVHRAEEIDLG